MSGNEKQTGDDPHPENRKRRDHPGCDKKNGRGAYICRSGECLEKAIRNHGIERSLKTGILPEIYDSLKKEIEKIESE